LKQELQEEKIQRIVEARLAITSITGAGARGASPLLDRVKWELECATEKGLPQLLGKPFLGISLIDWVISAAFITGPVFTAALTPVSVVAPTPSDLVGVALNLVEPLVQAVAVLGWTCASMFVAPNRLMCVVLIVRWLLLVPLLLAAPATVLAATRALVGSGDVVFIYFNFMGQAVGDTTKLALRTATLMALRGVSEALYLPVASNGVVIRVFIVIVLGFAMSILSPLILTQAPAAYRDFRLPGFCEQLLEVPKKRVLVMLAGAMMARSLAFVPSEAFLAWRAAEGMSLGWNTYSVSSQSVLLAGGTLAGVAALGLAIRMYPDATSFFVKAFACFSVSPVALRCWGMLQVGENYLENDNLTALGFGTSALDGLVSMATAVAILATVGSRWRFIVYTALTACMCSVGQALSFVFVWAMSGMAKPLQTHNATGLAQQLLLLATIAGALELVCRLGAALAIDRESTAALWTPFQSKLESRLRKS